MLKAGKSFCTLIVQRNSNSEVQSKRERVNDKAHMQEESGKTEGGKMCLEPTQAWSSEYRPPTSPSPVAAVGRERKRLPLRGVQSGLG